MHSKEFHFCLSLGKLNKDRRLRLYIVAFFIITERYTTVISRHLGNLDSRPASFQIQNGGCVLMVCREGEWERRKDEFVNEWVK